MKITHLLIWLLLLSPLSKAQIKVWQMSLRDSNLNILYVGVPNMLSFENLPSNVSMKFSNGTIDRLNGRYAITCPIGNRIDTLSIYKNGSLIFSKLYQVRYIKDPYPRLGIVKGNTATVNEILAYPELLLIIDSCYLKAKVPVISFEAIIPSGENGKMTFSIRGDELSEELINAIKRLKRGDKIIFDDIRSRAPDSPTRSYNSFTITII